MAVLRGFVQRGKGECSNCAWVPQSALIPHGSKAATQAAIWEAFNGHDCANYPHLRGRGPGSQAAAGTMQDATEKV
jgi:hypothetical protein